MKNLSIQIPRWAKTLLASAKRYKWAYGGRGGGKSFFFAQYIISRCIGEKRDAVCIREYQKSLKFSSKKTIEDAIEMLGVSDLFSIQADRILCPHGGTIIFTGMNDQTADNLKSLQGFDIAWVDEASNLSARSLEILKPTIRKEGSQLLFSWNPTNRTDPVDALFRGESPHPESVAVETNYTDNPWFPPSIRRDIDCDRKTNDIKYRHIWLGEYLEVSDVRVFHNWGVAEFDAPADAQHRFGADWGFSVDPTVLIRCHIEGRKLYIDYEAYQVGCEIQNIPALFATVPESSRWPITADSARPETISYLQHHGFPHIIHSVKGKDSVAEGIAWMQSYEIVIHPRCQHTIDEFRAYSWMIDRQTDKPMPVLRDHDNHVIDSIRYACEGARRGSAADGIMDYMRSQMMEPARA
jgi:phage terminase large subunit